ncbi:MAG: hypothetical protein IFK94_10250 [Acidobacteria bacterium]|uniref:DUF2007 domain-containing protein n=1 Tax=Candidatus Polarisedimenticola svalbardensis TaxID=2886004 RepID=A0A8J6Y1L6_9BACT|nr:hypothetical protein [Candidatus Polarisedimenticola svalbardensis]
MFCPVCKSEYLEPYTHCDQCNVDLVVEIPAGDSDMEEMVPVLRTNNQPLLAIFEAALTANNIPHYIRGGEAASLMPTNAVVIVPPEHLDTARGILFDAENSPAAVEPKI